MRRHDARDFGTSRTAAERVATLRERAAAVSRGLPGDERIEIASFDATTGNASRVVTHGAVAAASDDDLIAVATRHAVTIGPAFGTGSAPPEFVPDLALQSTSAGEHVVHLQQCHRGIPIFQSAITVRLDAQRRIVETVGSVIAVERVDATALPVCDAVLAAARDLVAAVAAAEPEQDQFGQPIPPALAPVEQFEPVVTATFNALPESPTVLEPGPFAGPIQASLVWFPADDGLVLAWDVALPRPGDGTIQRTIVGGSGAILYAQLLAHGLRAEGDVYVRDGSTPRTRRPFPLPQSEYVAWVPGAASAAAFEDWVDGIENAGNTTIAHIADADLPAQGVAGADGTVLFSPPDAGGDAQKVVNLFYYACVMHDLFYLLGFREADGNFEADNHAAGGLGSDRVDAQVCRAEIPRTASFVTPPDGSSPTMLMGPVTDTGRHCAMDSSVVFHEFTHGVSNRLVGGPATASGLMSPQSQGMGEGWSDFVACVMTDSTVVGSWVVNDPKGIRGFPYDSDFPDGFDKLGTGRYVSSVHNVGELWCAALMEAGRTVGFPLLLQLVIDAMKLSGANPSFLNMRDSLLAAAAASATAQNTAADAQAALTGGIWRAFAKFGMGPKAACNGAQLIGIVADFTPPAT